VKRKRDRADEKMDAKEIRIVTGSIGNPVGYAGRHSL
jgi:hypothetical protein